MRYAICYVNTTNKDLQRDEIEDLLEQAQQNNIEKDIRGILWYSKGNFFKVLEGDKNNVIPLFNQIEKDPRHHSIIQVFGKEISHGSFDSYGFDIVTEENKNDPNSERISGTFKRNG